MSDSDTNTDRLIERELTGAARAFEPPAGLKQAVRERISAEAAETPSPRRSVFRRLLPGSLGVAAAAVLIAAVILYVLPNGGSSDAAYAQLAAAIHSGQATKWVHIVYMGNAGRSDMWLSFRPFRRFHKSKQDISAADEANRAEYSYDPAENVLQVSPWEPPKSLRSVGDVHEAMQKKLAERKAQGARIRTETETLGVRTFTVFTVVDARGRDSERWLVDKRTGLVALFEELDPDGEDDCPGRMTFDYPATGPADIYALGVPRDAKVVDMRPGKDVRALDATVETACKAFAPTYRAVLCRASVRRDGTYRALILHVVHKRGRRYRVAEYGPANLPGILDVTDRAAVEAWLAKSKPFSVRFIDGGGENVWVRLDRQTGQLVWKPYGRLRPYLSVEGLTWGQLDFKPMSGVVLREQTQDGRRLLVREQARQGRARSGKVIDYPTRTRHWHDPDRDHALCRWEQLEDIRGEWQRDKTWLKGLPAKSFDPGFRRRMAREVLAFAQTPQGQWYARKVLSESEASDRAGTSRVVSLVYLDTECEVPQRLLAPDEIEPEQLAPTSSPR